MVLDIESYDYNQPVDQNEGVKVALVHFLDMPLMNLDGVDVQPGASTSFAINPTLSSTSDTVIAR